MLYLDKLYSNDFTSYHLEMYSLVHSRPTGYLIKYNLFTTISELSDLFTNVVCVNFDCVGQPPETQFSGEYGL